VKKLDQIFSIPDPEDRKKELLEYARDLSIGLGKTKNEKGDIDENKLAVLIYETTKNKEKARKQAVILIVVGFVFFVGCLLMVYAASRLLGGF